MAKIYFRFGAMNCGKTTALLQVAHNYEEKGMNILLIKPAIDKKVTTKREWEWVIYLIRKKIYGQLRSDIKTFY